MNKRKQLRTRGKLSLSKYFQEFKEGDRVSIVREHAVQPKFPITLQGRSGIVESKRGNSYLVKIRDLNKEKVYIIHPIHLRRLK
jgi:ribosomal protein L21E